MYFLPRARDQLTFLHEHGPPGLVDRIEKTLDELEKDPGAAHLRARRFQNPPAFVVPVRFRAHDYLIMWRLDEGEAAVLYVGASF